MAHEDKVMENMESLGYADKHVVGDVMAVKVGWKEGTSAVNQAYKALCNLVDLKKLEKADGFFKLPGLTGEYKEHSQALTKCIAEVLKTPHVVHVKRELDIPEVGLRADAVFLIENGNRGIAAWLEVVKNETPEYLKMKHSTFCGWGARHAFFTKLFGWDKVEMELFVVHGADGYIQFNHFLDAIRS